MLYFVMAGKILWWIMIYFPSQTCIGQASIPAVLNGLGGGGVDSNVWFVFHKNQKILIVVEWSLQLSFMDIIKLFWKSWKFTSNFPATYTDFYLTVCLIA